MNIILIIIMSFFWGLLAFYSILMLAGVYYRLKKSNQDKLQLSSYPSVSILIPAHNEGIVIRDTLHAMCEIDYPGELNIYILDDSSTDNTAEISKNFQNTFSRIHYIPVPQGEPKGKSRVLNYGLTFIQTEYFLVYDADNEPKPDAVRLLVEKAVSVPNAAGAVGYVKTKNAAKNLLTQMIALEFQVFQLLMQCGRWQLFKIGSLAGTNMLLKRQAIEEIGGYDVHALAEDAELTIRLTAAGYLLPVEAEAKTWEQEPETLKTYIKQRTRWLIGNIYLLEKIFTSAKFWRKKVFHHSFQHLSIYLFFTFLLLLSHIFFFGSLLGWFEPEYTAPVLLLWFMSYIVYTLQLIGAIVVERDISPIKVFVAVIMYFTYAQLFVLLLGRSTVVYLWKKIIKKEDIAWDKTNRFKSQTEK
ncbi:N-acetylglucosaminyltransferase [Virgibacillus dokdonensis]|uniref:N-acetylglucosaminyltransferase n=1 Tax=Virgibacillus dokdonensis TaxID=302167 RepID=A0A3E0WP98_9BACI|nr:glycosyltransferase [Virgibacillus dokdonensis]RFA34772.1 N-acetylglucosaminyltransferase [Virgibacillus dokdonensis]